MKRFSASIQKRLKGFVAQEKIILAFMLLIALTTLFPPFKDIHPSGGATNAGYSFIFLPPESSWGKGAVVDIATLLVEWGAIFMLCASAWFLATFNSNKSS